MSKIIIIFFVVISLNGMGIPNITIVANNVKNKIMYIDNNNPSNACKNYRIDSMRYLVKGYQSPNRDVALRYFDIADKYANQYGNCVKAYYNNVYYQGFKTNRYN